MYLQQAVNASWHMMKADAKVAFLQGKEFKREVSIIPTTELVEAYKLNPHELNFYFYERLCTSLLTHPRSGMTVSMRPFWKWDDWLLDLSPAFGDCSTLMEH